MIEKKEEDRAWRFEFPQEGMRPYAHYCLTCRHYLGGWRCKAYPNGILREIRDGRLLHFRELPGDQGYRYEPAPEVKAG